MTKHLNSAKHVMMMGGATEEECKRYDCGKARLKNCINFLLEKDHPLSVVRAEVRSFDRLIGEYNDYKEKYDLNDPWLEEISNNRIMMDFKQKLNELQTR